MILETDIEQKFVTHARTEGCLSIKLEIPSQRDFPDQLVLCPFGKAFFIEFKLPNEEPRRGQLFIHKTLKRLGFKVYVCDDYEQSKRILKNEMLEAASLSDNSVWSHDKI